MELKWYQRALYSLLVLTPVVAILILIAIVYFGYVFTYLLVLMDYGDSRVKSYPYEFTSSAESAYTKGITLFILVTFFTIMMMINFFRAILMDPGYFPSPDQLEGKIILKHSNIPQEIIDKLINGNSTSTLKDNQHGELQFLQEKFKFLSNFNHLVQESPLYSKEADKISEEITTYMKDLPRDFGKDLSSQSTTIKAHTETETDIIEINNNKRGKEDLFDNFMPMELTKVLLCGTCMRLKIERSHHCRLCGKCVMKMDHHCPWLANCIGFRNYKYFLLIHFHGVISSLIVLFSYWEVVVNTQLNYRASTFDCWLSQFIYLCNFGLLGFLTWLILVNWKLALSNLTVIENSDKERFPSTKSLNIYDLGKYRNFCSVFGDNPLVWFLPFGAPTKGEGYVYENIYKVRVEK